MSNQPESGNQTYLDPAILSKISSLEILAKRVVEGFITGLHKSPYQGFNVEFSEHRPYNPGDDIRHIDWKALAKIDRYYVKKFEEETNVKAYIVMGTSGPMAFQSGAPTSKIQYARFLCASLAYLMLLQRDGVGLCLFADGVNRFVAPRASRSHLHVIVEELKGLAPQGETGIPQAVQDLSSRIPKRGLVVVISDLLGPQKEILESLRHIRHRRNEVIVFQILDPHEIDVPWKGYLRMVDMEDGTSLATDPSWLLKDYRKRIEEFLDLYRQGCAQEGIDHVLLSTDQPLDSALASYLAHRMRRTRA